MIEYSDDFNFYKKIPNSKDVIEEYDMKQNKIKNIRVELIKGKVNSKKLTKFYEHLANDLNAKFECNKLI